MRKLETEIFALAHRQALSGGHIVTNEKAAIAIVLATIGRRDIGDAMARKIAAKHGAIGAYRLARQLENAM